MNTLSPPSPSKSDGFLATLGLPVMRMVELHGIDPQSFMKQVGMSADSFRDPRARIPARFAEVIFSKAAALIPDPAFALKAAECWHPSNLGPMGYAWLSSSSLRMALKRLDRYSRILGSQYRDRCVDDADGLRYVFDHRRGDAPIGPVLADFTLSIVMGMCRMNYGQALCPLVVNLRRAMPQDSSPWLDFFGGEVRFGATEDSFVLEHRVADMPLPSGNQDIAAGFDRILDEQYAALTKTDLKTRCKVLLLQQLTSGELSEEELANQVHMSGRTLQRKLADSGLTYKKLLEETRYDLAQRYLQDPHRSVTEVTFLLGFSEQSAFTRAFKRWSGLSPTDYRSKPSAMRWD